MKNRKPYISKEFVKNMLCDINRLIKNNTGKIAILEILEEIPYNIRVPLLESVALSYDRNMVEFMHLLRLEYGKEWNDLVKHSLEKYAMSGINIDNEPKRTETFYRAFANCTRDTGKLSLDIAWLRENGRVDLECFLLSFSDRGIQNFVIIENIPISKYKKERNYLKDMVTIGFDEACYFIKQAYSFNVFNMTRPALGKFIYQKYLDRNVTLNKDQECALLHKLSGSLEPVSLINHLFYALKNFDFHYLLSILPLNYNNCASIKKCFEGLLQPGVDFLEGNVKKIHDNKHAASVLAEVIFAIENQFFIQEYEFQIKKVLNKWMLTDIAAGNCKVLDLQETPYNFDMEVNCRVYDIIDLEYLFDYLDDTENIYEAGEIPFGMHLRMSSKDMRENVKVTFFDGVIADFVINSEVMIMFSPDEEGLYELDDLLLGDGENASIMLRKEFKSNIWNVHNFLRGYVSDIDRINTEQGNGANPEGVLLFMSVHYFIKDIQAVEEHLNKITDRYIDLPDNCKVFYKLERLKDGSDFFAEYFLTPEYVTVSAFGDKDMYKARKIFEYQMYDNLELESVEVNAEGIFDILSEKVKKLYPQLEKELKDVYLNKWYHSRQAFLSGMSPSEASQTEEGHRMIWTLLKNLKNNSKKSIKTGYSKYIRLYDYINKIEQKKQ
ncbi:MAG: hypothetical protein LBK69_07900 [Syntrophomonadaceae bacterium]|nr:hypothetical protein [Syntrophomonadaceae bacterium]